MNISTILLAEDEPTSVFFFQHIVKKLGILNPLHVAKDGREALDYLEGAGEFADREKFPLPGLVILDLKMPRVSGLGVLHQLRQRPDTRKIIVLMLTSSVSDEDISEAYALGVNGYLVKPLQLEKLQEMVQAIKDFWLIHNCAPPVDDASRIR